MGVGRPRTSWRASARGVDMFDCVLPTRIGRHGTVFTPQGTLTCATPIRPRDPRPMEPVVDCYACRNFSRAYMRHLLRRTRCSGSDPRSIHNLRFLVRLMEEIRAALAEGPLPSTARRSWSAGTPARRSAGSAPAAGGAGHAPGPAEPLLPENR